MMEDWRFRKSPHVEHGGLRAYAGAPLRLQQESGDCVALGSLCVASSTSQDPLTKSQQNTLARLADWVVSDIIQCARARRQRERRRMSELISAAQQEMESTHSENSVLQIIRKIYPMAVVSLQLTKAGSIDIGERRWLLLSDLEDGLWEDIEYLKDFIDKSNHQDLPSNRIVRVITAPCESLSGKAFLVVASRDFRHVFDDVDSWFVQTCATMLSQMWQKRLLVEAIEAKESFLRGISHQLRTPLHGILSSVELLAEELRLRSARHGSSPIPLLLRTNPVVDPSMPSVYLDTIKTAGRDLISIINNMITLNRWADIAMADRDFATHTIYELEAELVNEIHKEISGSTHCKASIFFNHEPSLHSDSLRVDLGLLRDSVFPLLNNAVQNTSEGIIVVNISIPSDDHKLIVDVQDTGCGIHPDHQQRIFEPYEKVDVHSTGIGLGLTLASRFAALLNGSIDLVSSEIGRGSHFRATFQEAEYIYSPVPAQTLAAKLTHVPSKFTHSPSASNTPSLCEYFTRFLARNGFTASESAEDSFAIFSYASDLEKHHTYLSQIPIDQVAICLIPASEEDTSFEPSANVVYVSGPFSSAVMSSALEEADRLLSNIQALRACQSRDDTIVSEEALVQSLVKTRIESGKDVISLTTIYQPDIAATMESKIVHPRFLDLTNTPKPTALLVDDSVINLRILKMYCKKRGLPYHCATDGLQAVEIFSRHQSLAAAGDGPPIQLILMDLQMPVCDGIEATRRIRLLEEENKWENSVLFIVTGQDGSADRRAAESAGAHDYFVKPVGMKVLDRSIKRHFPAFTAG